MVTLQSYPQREILFQKEFTPGFTVPVGPTGDLAARMGHFSRTGFPALASDICGSLIQAERKEFVRPLFHDPDDPDSLRAYDNAINGDWTLADTIWQIHAETGQGGWKDYFNLGVSAERRQDYESARNHYDKARLIGVADPAARGIAWDGLFEALSQTLSVTVPPLNPDSDWFSKPMAILPFELELDGHQETAQWTREHLFDRLASSGYTLVPLERIDATLKKEGLLTDNKSMPLQPDVLTKLFNVSRLIYGKIEVASTEQGRNRAVTQMAGQFSMWDKTAHDWIWSVDAELENALLGEPGEAKELETKRGLAISKDTRDKIGKNSIGISSFLLVHQLAQSLPRRFRGVRS